MSRTTTLFAITAALMLSAAPAFAQSCPALKQLAQIKMTRAANGQFLVPVAINGTKKQMVLATGEQWSLIRPSVAAQMKLPLRTVQSNIDFGPAPIGSSTQLGRFADNQRIDQQEQMAHADDFAVGSLESGQGYFMLGAADTDSDMARAGSLGMDALSKVDFDIDPTTGTLNLFSQDHCPGQVVYWKPQSALALPFTYDSKKRIRIQVTLDGVKLNALLDTASTGDVMNMDIAKSDLKFSETGAGVSKLADQPGTGAKNYSRRFGKLSLDGIDISNPLVTVREDRLKKLAPDDVKIGSSIRQSAEDNREPDYTLGQSTLSKLHVYVASREMKLYLSPAAPAK